MNIYTVATAAYAMAEMLGEKQHPDVEITFNFDSSGTRKKQIQNGAECDIFISAAQKQMNQLDGSKDVTNSLYAAEAYAFKYLHSFITL